VLRLTLRCTRDDQSDEVVASQLGGHLARGMRGARVRRAGTWRVAGLALAACVGAMYGENGEAEGPESSAGPRRCTRDDRTPGPRRDATWTQRRERARASARRRCRPTLFYFMIPFSKL
jgi:hypothetical protein